MKKDHQLPDLKPTANECSPEVSKVLKRLEQLETGIKEKFEELKADASASAAVCTDGWTEVLKKEAPKKIITNIVEASSDVALKKSIQLIDANLTEQRKRSRNVIITGVEEHAEENLVSTVIANLNGECVPRDIGQCKRLGTLPKPSEKRNKPVKPRPILVIFRDEQDALYFHNYSRGRKVFSDQNVWVNPDLTRTEREAMYMKRENRRTKKRSSSIRDTASAIGCPIFSTFFNFQGPDVLKYVHEGKKCTRKIFLKKNYF